MGLGGAFSFAYYYLDDVSVVGGSSDCAIPPLGMVSWWPLDEQAGATAVTDIIDGNSGTPRPAAVGQGGPIPDPGMVGGSLSFDGMSMSVQVGNAPNLNVGTGDLSIDAWILTPAPGTGLQPIVDKEVAGPTDAIYGYSLYLQDGFLGFSMNNDITVSPPAVIGTTDTTINLTDLLWHHVAVSVARTPASASGGVLYVDGVVVATFSTLPFAGLSADNVGDLFIGATNPFRAPLRAYFEGDIDEVEIFNTALTAAGRPGSLHRRIERQVHADRRPEPDPDRHPRLRGDAHRHGDPDHALESERDGDADADLRQPDHGRHFDRHAVDREQRPALVSGRGAIPLLRPRAGHRHRRERRMDDLADQHPVDLGKYQLHGHPHAGLSRRGLLVRAVLGTVRRADAVVAADPRRQHRHGLPRLRPDCHHSGHHRLHHGGDHPGLHPWDRGAHLAGRRPQQSLQRRRRYGDRHGSQRNAERSGDADPLPDSADTDADLHPDSDVHPHAEADADGDDDAIADARPERRRQPKR